MCACACVRECVHECTLANEPAQELLVSTGLGGLAMLACWDGPGLLLMKVDHSVHAGSAGLLWLAE